MTGNSDLTGFYDISQLASRKETDRQKGYIGVLPWSRSQIERLIKAGKFPKPISDGYKKIWPKAVIHEYIESLKLNGGKSNVKGDL